MKAQLNLIIVLMSNMFLIVLFDANCYGQTTNFVLQPNYVAVRTASRTTSQPYYEFWDSNVGWAGINCGNILVTGQISGSGAILAGGSISTSDNFFGKNIYLNNNGNTLRFLPSNSGVEIGSSTGNITFWYSGLGFNNLFCGNLITTGKIGVGTSNPDALLTVKGNIHAQEVRVDLSVPADYVFKSDYKLMPLKDVEQYVKNNSHLPEIPSATEIKQNGLNLGEMQNKLLQKLEEMTLYIISQQKQIDELKLQIEKLKKQLQE